MLIRMQANDRTLRLIRGSRDVVRIMSDDVAKPMRCFRRLVRKRHLGITRGLVLVFASRPFPRKFSIVLVNHVIRRPHALRPFYFSFLRVQDFQSNIRRLGG